MKKIIFNLLLSFLATAMFGQDIDSVLKEIEANSTTLGALREQIEAEKIGNKTGIYLSNPEVEFNYLWGSPTAIGNRTDLVATQSFDFPTAYLHRKKISGLENQNLDLQYKSERINLLLRAKQICIELAYYNALTEAYDTRLQHAERIAASYQKRFETGDINILEKNKSQVNLTMVENERKNIEIERIALLSQLEALNGGIPIRFDETTILSTPLPLSFDDWFAVAAAKSPAMQHLDKQIEIDKQQIKLNRALGMPKLHAGYMSEKVVGEYFRGVTVGISIPLWENKNKVRHAKAQLRTAEAVLEDNKIQFYKHLQQLFNKSTGLQENARKYRQTLNSHNNEALLKKSLDLGEISLLTYLLEAEYYYDTVNKTLEAERDFQLTLAELSAVEL